MQNSILAPQNTLTWDIVEKPVFGNNSQLEGYKGIFRNDNGKLLHIAK